MKRIVWFIVFSVWFAATDAIVAQSAKGFSFQSVMRDNRGREIANRELTVRLSVQKKLSSKRNAEPVTLYSETHLATTDAHGRIRLEIGKGTSVTGRFDTIDWWGDVLIKTEIDPEGTNTFSFAGIQQPSSVPYVFSAEKTAGLKSEDGTIWNLVCDDRGNLKAVPVPDRFTKLVFYDEFDGTGLPDPAKWSFEEGFVRNGEMQYYTVGREENCYRKDGSLHLVCRNDSAWIENAFTHKKWIYPWVETRKDTMVPVTSASIHTRGKFAFTYGRIEMRAKLPVCLGSWPAIWLMPHDDEYGYWPSSGEIDMMEHVGYAPEEVHYTLHSDRWNSNNQPNKYAHHVAIDHPEDWHVYALEWHPDRICWYLDGELKTTVIKGINAGQEEWPFHLDFYLILNFAFGGGWGGREGVDLEALPQTYTIDYVRIYQ